ncbi:MAG: VCBS repeat-containing protein [Saprospiraceae bacterium]|nr:VCBS repeat-containing protein [Saprospiraceae bacterium]
MPGFMMAQGQFIEQTIDDQIQIGYGITIGDVNGDGFPDILLADKKAFVWYRNPDWKRFVMVENLTERDNVCLAARDINGDGRVEVAVGAQWNPGETTDEAQSGSVHYLIRPSDPTKPWHAIQLLHEPTVHRMGWVRTEDGFQLVVVPLHGRDNQQGQGKGVRVYSYLMPDDPQHEWRRILLDSSMHITHNFDIVEENDSEALLIGGREGSKLFRYDNSAWHEIPDPIMTIGQTHGFGEIRRSTDFIVGVQPFHGNLLNLYLDGGHSRLLSETLQQGHGLACADLLAMGQDQVVVGWRENNTLNQFGIKIFIPNDRSWNSWQENWIDENGMACEDLKLADLDGDGKMDIIASGRSTNNLKIYWNKN